MNPTQISTFMSHVFFNLYVEIKNLRAETDFNRAEIKKLQRLMDEGR